MWEVSTEAVTGKNPFTVKGLAYGLALLASLRATCPDAQLGSAGWSSPVARQAHNLKVVGSNPTPATIRKLRFGGVFFFLRKIEAC